MVVTIRLKNVLFLSLPRAVEVRVQEAIVFSLLFIFWKIEVYLCDPNAVCVPLCLWIPSLNFWMPHPILTKLGMYITVPEPISTAYYIKSFPWVCVSVCVSLLSLLGKGSVKCIIPPLIAGQRLGKHVPAAMNKRNDRIIVRRIFLWVYLCIPLLLLGNNSTKTFPRQRRIVGGVFIYAVRVVPNEIRQLILPRTSCFRYFSLVVFFSEGKPYLCLKTRYRSLEHTWTWQWRHMIWGYAVIRILLIHCAIRAVLPQWN
jgi:hypothetical protein